MLYNVQSTYVNICELRLFLRFYDIWIILMFIARYTFEFNDEKKNHFVQL